MLDLQAADTLAACTDVVCALSQNHTHLLQEKFPILVEEENAEGSVENAPGRARYKPMRQVLVHMAHNLIVLVQRDHLIVEEEQA